MSSESDPGGTAAVSQDVAGASVALPDQRYFLVSLILSVVGGFADAGSFVLVHSFTGHITGNSILMAVYMAQGRWAEVATCVVAIIAFLAGTAAGTGWPHVPGRSACRRLAGPIAIEIVLIGLGLAGLSLAPQPSGRTLFIACLCLALGVQNGVLGKIASTSFHTTFITGLSTMLVASFVAGHTGPKRKLLPPIIGCFIVGAFVGAFTASQLGSLGFAVVLAPLVLGWLLVMTEPARK